jgi:predicted DNA-binding WGR domain protein
MKLIKQTLLLYQQGSSDKVYEVDLCEVGTDRYVVNFRYGRRGTTLKEGAKTVAAVPRAEAEKVFNDLVASKTKKGYRDVTGQPVGAAPKSSRQMAKPPVDPDARNQVILNRLAEAARRDQKKGRAWSMERVIWRAGELKLRAAVPLLINLIGSGSALRDYCLAWALGFCGDESAMEPLSRLYSSSSATDAVRRIAGEALLKLSDDATRAEFRADLVAQLPPELREAAQSGPAEDFARALQAYLEGGDFRRFAILETIYLIDNEHVRPALLDVLRTAPLKPNYFQRVRHIFKAAEYRRDAEVFGLIAYRFETERAMFRNSYHPLSRDEQWSYLYVEGRYVENARQEIQGPASKIAYGHRTRFYFRQRVWRTLRRLGELGDADYVRMAVGVLLPFSDADAQPVKESSFYNWNTRRARQVHWDAYAGYWAFNYILYRHSPRYELKPNSKAWRCRPNYKPGEAEPAAREEAFPALWEQRPQGLLHLISESNCQPVHHFAVKALAACQQFCDELDLDAVIMILNRPYEVTARFGFELAKARYQPDAPDHTLVLAVLNCASAEARAQAQRWVDDRRAHFLEDSELIAALAASAHADNREFARNLLLSAALSETAARAVINGIIARLTALAPEEAALTKDIGETLLKCFGPQLRTIEMRVVLNLLAHPLFEVQELGGQILLNHTTQARDLPEEIILSLIRSPYEPLRAIGIKLLGQLPDETLRERERLLVELSTHALADLRQAMRPVIHRLSHGDTDPAFAIKLSSLLLGMLLKAEKHEGVHQHLVRMLREDIGGGWMSTATKQTVWKLLHAGSAAAQDMGAVLLEFKLDENIDWAEQFETNEIAKLSNHEIRLVREATQRVFTQVFHRYRQETNPRRHLEEMAQAVRLLDAKWDNARDFYFQIFRERFTAEDFTPAILVNICDSVREDVQRLGRELISRHFETAAGQEYLLKLSEHPSADLQLFATNYLERYAANDPSRLKELTPYFTSVLSRINRARVAKSRVLAFLTAEALKSEEAARIVAEILIRQSVTIAIGDRAAAIEAMLQIHRIYPEVPLPIHVKTPEVRHAV